jgi:teichuronic acid biosynthesis glycosyltransferase TuaC
MRAALKSQPRVLVLSRSYPNRVLDVLGLWVESLVRYSTRFCEPRVVSVVPYCPPLPGLPTRFAQFRAIEHERVTDGVKAYYPRFLSAPGNAAYKYEHLLYGAGVDRLIKRIRREFPFDLIHAHFTYPDGVVAARLARKYGVPFVITEHAPWDPWTQHPEVLQRAVTAARDSAAHISVSRSALASVQRFAGNTGNLVVIPNGVDGSVFTRSPGTERIHDQILFAGAVRPVKGVDVLLRSVRMLLDRGREIRLVIAGAPYYGRYSLEQQHLQRMVAMLGLERDVVFVGKKQPLELAVLMAQSAALVLPSRMESFGAVLIEALACGTPVVATRCGGPEDIVTQSTGVLAAVEDAGALAAGIEHVLGNADTYDPERLRAYALENFNIESVARRVAAVYESAIASHAGLGAPRAAHALGGSIGG